MDDAILDRIEKQMEGNGLAMAAVAEVLQKMDSRLKKAEEDDAEDAEKREEEEEMENAAMEKALLIKAVTNEVAHIFKASQYDGDAGMDVSPDPETKAKAEGPSDTGGADADDSESPVTIDSKTENVQHTIQAMQLQLQNLAKEYEDMDMDEEEDDDEGSEENIESGYYGKLENMQKQIMNLTKAVSTNNSIEKAVQRETEARLRKMGFREETGLQAPRQVNYDLGTDGTTPIAKAQTEGDTVDQLVNLSYKDLREIQTRIQAGETDGIPRELLG